MTADPFNTAALRRAVLAAWSSSPARFREDANAEEALAGGGYAGRVLVELAANAADAAREAGVPARIRVRLSGNELRVANTGSALTADGVAALSSLRASAKRDTLDSVGHFGVGFTAVVSWCQAPRVVSTTGGVGFDSARTGAAIAASGVPALDREVRLRDGQVPVLRLPWPTDATEPPPPDGYTTEVRLPLEPGPRAEVDRILTDPATAEDLFWALTDLAEIDLPDGVARCGIDESGLTVIDDGTVIRRYRTADRSGEIPPALLAGRPIEERRRTRWRITWAFPVGTHPEDGDLDLASLALAGRPGARPERTTIGAPTPTDEPLTLPARLVGTFPVDDTRRRLAAGPLLDHLLAQAADAYLDLLAGTDPADRWELLPAGGFPAGPIDGALRENIQRRVIGTPLLRTAVGDLVAPPDACLLPGLGEQGAALLGQAVPGLLPPQPAGAQAVLRGLGVQTLSWSQASAALAGIERDAAFWWQVYEAVARAERPPDPEDLADIPIPLIGGRRAIGARGCLLPDVTGTAVPGDTRAVSDAANWVGTAGGRIDPDLARRVGTAVPTLRIVDPAATHPFLERLGAVPADPDSLLADPGLLAAIESTRDDLDSGELDADDIRDLATVVLDLLAAGGRSGRVGEPSGPGGGANRSVLADLVLTDEDGRLWPAAELLMPGAALATVLAPDADRPFVGAEWSNRYPGQVLIAAGVRSGFAVVTVTDLPEDAVDLPDLDDWLHQRAGGLDGPLLATETFTALVDLDLVDDDRWPQALQLIAGDRATRECLTVSAAGLSYSGWWLSRFATIAGRPPAHWRLPGAADLAGLYDALPVPLDPLLARSIGVRAGVAQATTDDPGDVLDRLSDPDRPVPAGRVAAITAGIVAALAAVDDLDLPSGVRTLAGEVIDAEDACVLDEPWWVQVLPASRLVPGGADPMLVARVLDLPLASSITAASVLHDSAAGLPPAGQERERLRRGAAAIGVPVPTADIMVTAGLRVAIGGAEAVPVGWWAAGDRYWTDGSAAAAGRVVAWAAGRWADRHLAIAAAGDDLAALAEDGVG